MAVTTNINDDPPTPDMVNEASKHVVWDIDGQQIPFKDLLPQKGSGRKTILIFIRHYMCGSCQQFVTALVDGIKPEQLKAQNIDLYIIGCGSYSAAKPYKDSLNCPFPIYSAPGKEVYVALGLTLRTLDRGSINPSYVTKSFMKDLTDSVSKAIKLRMVHNSGDIKQLGAEFVITEGPQFTFTHRMKNTRDHTEISELIKAAGIQPLESNTKPSTVDPVAVPAPPVQSSTNSDAPIPSKTEYKKAAPSAAEAEVPTPKATEIAPTVVEDSAVPSQNVEGTATTAEGQKLSA